MIVDAKTLKTGAQLDADICIIGSGPAGLAIALEYVNQPVRVLVLEAGGPETESGESSLSRLAPDTCLAERASPLPGRRLGGNANLWRCVTPGATDALRLVPLNAADFDLRPWMTESGWPIGLTDIAPYYARALDFFGLPSRGFEPQEWSAAGDPLPLNTARVRTRMFQFASAGIIIGDHMAKLKAAPNITICYNACALELITHASGSSVTGVRIASAPGREHIVSAGQVVVAAGGVWSTQLLMASDAVARGGLGNRSGHLGRHFHTHPLVRGGVFIPSTPDLHRRMRLYDLNQVDGVAAMGHLQLSDETLLREQVLNLGTLFYPFARGAGHPQLSKRQAHGVNAFKRIRKALRNRWRPSIRDALATLIGADGIALEIVAHLRNKRGSFDDGAWPDLSAPDVQVEGFEVLHITEQSPHPDHRATLSDARDALGMRKLEITWTYRADDAAALRRSQEVLARELAAAGLGTYRIETDRDGPVILESHANHFFGLTRMSEHWKDGVVDTNCRVHGVDNLYVASSSVFPTGGFANPTLTIVAMAQRVADTIRERMMSRAAA